MGTAGLRVHSDNGGTMERFASRLKLLRTARKISISELCAAAEVAVSYLYDIESGRANVSLRMIDRFGAVFEIDPGLFVCSEPMWQAAIADGSVVVDQR